MKTNPLPVALTTRDNIVLQCAILFSTRQYESVTYSDIERATGLRRGSILYHFATKRELFAAVVEAVLFDRSAILDTPIPRGDVLRSFIDSLVARRRAAEKALSRHGITDHALARLILTSSAHCHFPGFGPRLRQMRAMELTVWTRVIERAMEQGEISGELPPETLASLFAETAETGHEEALYELLTRPAPHPRSTPTCCSVSG